MKKINKVILELYNDKKQILFLAFLTLLDYLTKDILIEDTGVYHATMGVIAVATALLDEQKEEYKSMQFKNPFAGMQNKFANLENTYEDLTVNQQQAQFQAQQGAQQRANIMQSLRGAAGGSGIAGLAQAMAGQGQLQTQRISADIGQQESRNQALMARGATAVDLAKATGASQVQTAQMQGQQWVQQSEMNRQATLLGMQMGQTAGAETALASARANQMSAEVAKTQAATDAFGNVSSAAIAAGKNRARRTNPGGGDDLGGVLPEDWGGDTYDPNVDYSNVSDRRLKKNISKISKSPSGLNIYSFEFKDSKYGEGVFQGVMSDEVPQEAVSNINGYDRVNYDILDVEFKQI